MNRSLISRIFEVVPERRPRLHNGSPFAPSQAAAGRAAQLAQLARHLGWLSPLHPLSKEDRAALGQLSPHGRPGREDEELDSEASSLIGD